MQIKKGKANKTFPFCLVQAKRLELPRLAALDPKSSASANSAMPAFGDPTGTRTRDPKIKSLVLYQLSYWIIHSVIWLL